MEIKDANADKNMYKKYIIVAGVFAVFMTVAFFFSMKDESAVTDTAENLYDDKTITDLFESATADKNYIVEGEIRDEQLEKKLNQVLGIVERLQQDLSDRDAKIVELTEDSQEIIALYAEDNKRLQGELDNVQAEVERLKQQQVSVFSDKSGVGANTNNFNGTNSPFSTGGIENAEAVSDGSEVSAEGDNPLDTETDTEDSALGIGLIRFTLKNESDNSIGRSLTEYLPAGSYVSAVIISGADAGVGTRFKSDPKPVLIRVTGKAKTVAFEGGEPQEMDLRGCMITGSATGDLSSEKVYIRTITMTCSFSEGKANEYEIHGYAAGTGKAGIRGPVVSREGDLIEKSFIAGLISGLGDGVNQAFQPTGTTSTTAGGNRTIINDDRSKQQKLTDSFGSGIGVGFKNSADRISQYLIERAEQYQPVVSLQSGTEVEVVFLKGIPLQQPYVQASVQANNDERN